MLFLPNNISEVFLFKKPISMRCGPDRLMRFCTEDMGVKPEPGKAFLFFNKKFDHLKLYFVDHEGDQSIEKKLDKGGFLLPTSDDDRAFLKISATKLDSLFRSAR